VLGDSRLRPVIAWPGTFLDAAAKRRLLSRGHIVFRLDHSNQKSGRLMPQNLAAEECCGGGHKSQGAATPTLTGNAS
jgi:hypothetical protein